MAGRRGGGHAQMQQRVSQQQLIQQTLQQQQRHHQQQHNMNRPMRGMATPGGFAVQRNIVMKRPMVQSSAPIPYKQPRMAMRPTGPPNVVAPRPTSAASLCRLCAQASSFTYPIKEKPETVEAVQFVLNFQLDEDPAYPDTVCRRCCTVLATFSQFKKTFEEGQVKLKEMIESKQRPASPSNIIKTNTKIVSEVDTSEMSILPGIFSPFFPSCFAMSLLCRIRLCKLMLMPFIILLVFVGVTLL
jgi:hypothetical protein